MKIHPENVSKTHSISTDPRVLSVSSTSIRPQDTFITMKNTTGGLERVKKFFTGIWEKVCNVVRTAWEWVYWVIRLFPSENTRIEVIESMIDEPKQAAKEAKKNPVEFLGEVISAALIKPSKVDKLRSENSQEIGIFVRKFKELVDYPETLFHGENGILQTITNFLGVFSGLAPEQMFMKYLLERPNLAAGAIKRYCKKALSEIGSKGDENGKEELHAIKTVIKFFNTVADQAKTDPTGFENFLKGVFAQTSFNIEEIGKLANQTLDHVTWIPGEREAFRKCSESNHQALFRLNEKPIFLHQNLKNSNLGLNAVYGAFLEQLKPKDFNALSKLMKTDYPLGAEVCEHLADIAENPSQFKRVCATLPKAIETLTNMWGDYQAPPAEEY